LSRNQLSAAPAIHLRVSRLSTWQ